MCVYVLPIVDQGTFAVNPLTRKVQNTGFVIICMRITTCSLQ